MPPFFRYAIYACAGYALVAGIMFLAQRRMMYFTGGEAPLPAAYGVPDMTPVEIATADGLTLLAWHRPPSREGVPTILYLHGNAGHIGYRGDKVRPYLDAGYGVLLLAWRGYSGNPGSPTEEGLYADARGALDYLAAAGVADDQVVVYGESLGSGPAVQLASERDLGAVVLESPFTSAADVAQHHYWYLPARWLLLDRFESLARIDKIDAPLMIVHGEQDRVVPVKFGKALFAAASEPKEARFIPAAGHNDLYAFGVPEAVIDFLDRSFKPAG